MDIPTSQPPPPPPPAPVAQAPSPAPVNVIQSKSKLPKQLIFIVLGIFLLFGIVFAASFLFKSLGKNQAVTLTYWGLWEPESVMKPLIDEYQSTHPKIKIVYKQQLLTEYRERLQSAFGQGNGPDIFRLHNSWTPMFKGDLAPLPPKVFDAGVFESTFYPAVKDTLRVGNNYVAVPLMYDGLVMFVNDSLLQSAGLPAPQNWEDLKNTALAISRCDTTDGGCRPGSRILVSGAALGTTNNVDHWQDIISILMLQNNVNLAAPSGKSADDAIEYYSNFSRYFGVWDSTLPSSTNQFAAGKVGIYFGPSWRVFDIKSLNPNLKFSVYPLPQLPLDPDRQEKPVTWASFWVEGVNKKSSHSEEALDFLKFLSSQTSLQKMFDSEVSLGRDFGEPFSRVDMAEGAKTNPVLAVVLSQAPFGRSWYMASATQDGPSGLNTRLSAAFAHAINHDPVEQSLVSEINQILSQYGLSAIAP